MTILHFTQFCPSTVSIHIDEINQSGPVHLENESSFKQYNFNANDLRF